MHHNQYLDCARKLDYYSDKGQPNTRFNIVLLTFNIVLLTFNIVLLTFNIVLLTFNIVLLTFNIVLLTFNIVLLTFNIGFTDSRHVLHIKVKKCVLIIF